MALPYPTKVVLPFDIATAQDMNERHANDVALANGTGLDDEAVTAAKTSFGGNYSTSEVDTGFTWVDGKTVYKKTINFGSLPDSTSKSVSHGITGLDTIVDTQAEANNNSSYISIPYLSSGSGSVEILNSSTSVTITTGSNRTAYTAYVTLYYTKA